MLLTLPWVAETSTALAPNLEVYKVSVNGGSWAKIAGCCVTDIAADGGYVYGIGTNQEVYKVTAASWTNIAGSCVSEIDSGFRQCVRPWR